MNLKTEGVRFAEIQALLNRLIAGRNLEDLKTVHSEPHFGWDTLAQLKSLVIRPDGPDGPAYPLIDLELVQQKRGEETNLVRALSDPTGVDSYGQMPYRPPPGRYATPEEIQTIITWLNSGMPE